MSYRGFTYRLKPTPEQENSLLEWAGAARFVYNLALEQRRDWWRQYRVATGKNISMAGQSREVTDLRRDSDWLRAVPRSALEYALRDLDRAYAAFFRGAGFPKFRSKHRSVSFRVQARECSFPKLNAKWSQIKLPKVGAIKFRLSREMPARSQSVMIYCRAGRWFVTICGEADAVMSAPDEAVGIDRGVTHTLALSTGETSDLPRTVGRNVVRRQRAQRTMSRRVRGSKRREKLRGIVARLSAAAAACRKHWLHERSTDIANRFGQVAIEKLNTSNMTRAGRGKRGLNRAILEQGWATFANMLNYKLADRGGVLHYVNPAYTSQTCSCCGSVNAESRKSQAVFECVDCGHRANADTNAAINILRRSPAGVEGAGYGPVEARTGEMLTHLENLAA